MTRPVLGLAGLLFVYCLPLLLAPIGDSQTRADFDAHMAPYAAIRQDLAGWQWNWAYGLGQPVPSDPLISLFNPLAAVLLVGLGPRLGLWPLLYLSLLGAALVTWRLCRDLGCRSSTAAVGAAVLVCSGFMGAQLWVGHHEYILSLPALPLAWVAGRAIVAGRMWGISAAAGAVALPLLSGHAHYSAFAALVLAVIVAVGVVYAVSGPARARIVAWAAGAVLLGAGLTAVHALPMSALYGYLERIGPIDQRGSLPLLYLVPSLLLPLWPLGQEWGAGLFEPGRGATIVWWELTGYLGPLALVPLVAFGPAWREVVRCRAVVEGVAVLLAGVSLLDAWIPLLPAYWLLVWVPQDLALRQPSRALVLVTLGLAALIALGLERWARDASGWWSRRWRLVAGVGLLALVPVNAVPLVGLAAQIRQTARPELPAGIGDPPRLVMGRGISQLLLAEQGAVMLNNRYGWHLRAADDAEATFRLATGAIVRPGVPWFGPRPAWLAEVPGDGVGSYRVPPLVLPRRPELPLAYLTTVAGCLGLACPPEAEARVERWGGRIEVTADARAGQALVVAAAAPPGWSARVDDGAWQPVDPSLGVVVLPATPGLHRYALAYSSPRLLLGAAVTAAAALACLALVALGRSR